jgi:hypothetical protein
MTNPKSDYHRAWMKKLYARANAFDIANGARKRALQAQFDKLGEPTSPEERHAREYFMSHPLCSDFPACGVESGTLMAHFDDYLDDRHHIAAFMIAVRSASSIRCSAYWSHGDTAGGGANNIDDLDGTTVDEVREIENALREAGLWGAR